MGLLYLLPLLVLPGVWLAFWRGLPNIPFSARLALSLALTPLVLSFQFWIGKSIGLSLSQLAAYLPFANVAVVIFIWKMRPQSKSPSVSHSTAAKIVAAALPLLWVIGNWAVFDGLRSYGWHNLMHADICYQISREPLLLEEPELAAQPISYSWFGYPYWTVLAFGSGMPPTVVSSITNLILLLSSFCLLYHAGRNLDLSEAAATLAAGLGIFTSQFLGEGLRFAAAITGSTSLPDAQLLAETRLTTLLDKFVSIDGMTLAFPLFAALLLLCVSYVKEPAFATGLVAVIIVAGIGLIYTLAFPAALVLVIATVGERVFLSGPSKQHVTRRELAFFGLGCLAATLITYAWVRMATRGESASVLLLEPARAIKAKGIHLIWAIGPFLLLAFLGLVQRHPKRSWQGAGLFLAAVAFCCIYTLFSVRRLEYKYYFFAGMCLAIVGSRFFDRFAIRWNRAGWALALLIPAALGGLNWAHRFHFHANLPPIPTSAAPEEHDFCLDLPSNDPNAEWVRKVRNETTSDTIFLARHLRFHASAFIDRSLYFPCDQGGTAPGYNLSNETNLCGFRGYSKSLYNERELLVDTLFESKDPKSYERSLKTLALLNRPIAIHMPMNMPLMDWLTAQSRGYCLHRDDHQVIWMLDKASLEIGKGE
jgi:hypothetical protein